MPQRSAGYITEYHRNMLFSLAFNDTDENDIRGTYIA